MDFFWSNGLPSFLGLTVFLGGGAAYMSGRAVANGWEATGLMVWYCVLLAFAVQFLHFALFHAELLSVKTLIINFLVLLFFGFMGLRLTRVGQMVTQYRWLYERAGPFGWRERTSSK